MKFVHIADLHLDTPLISLKNNRELIKKRRLEQRQIFKEVIKFVKEEKVEFLFISGDVFEQKFVERNTVEYIIDNLSLIPQTKIFIAPGNHDPYIKNSPYRTYKWPQNVVIFDGQIKKHSFDDIDVYGYGFEDYESTNTQLKGFKVENQEKINILVTHGTLVGDSKYNLISNEDLKQFDYVALGHIHMQKLDNNIVYPGTLASCGFDELGEHGMVFGNIEKDNITYEFKNMEERHFKIINIDISNIKSANEIIDMIDIGEDIVRIVLTGDRNIDFNDIKETINLLRKKHMRDKR